MAIEFGCPVCGGTLHSEDDAVGQLVRCGGCLSMLRVPDTAHAIPPIPNPTTSPFPGSTAAPSTDAPPRRNRSSARGQNSPEEPGDRLEESPRSPQRKRIRREQPLPTGHSPFFLAVIAIGVFGVVSCILFCGLIQLLPGERWRSYTSTKGGFKVDLPAKQRSNMSIRGLNRDKSFRIEGTHLVTRGEDYAILYKDIDSTEKREAIHKGVFKDAVKNLEATGLVQDGDNREIEAYGFPAAEIEFHNGEGERYLVRIVVADTRMYILIVGGRSDPPEEENVHRFFNTFSFTNEELIKGDERGRVALLGKALAENTFETIDKEQLRDGK
jgi:hypothetical protein